MKYITWSQKNFPKEFLLVVIFCCIFGSEILYLVGNVVSEDNFPGAWECRVIHEAQDELEHGQGVAVVGIAGFGEEWRLDGLPFHAPDVWLRDRKNKKIWYA